jgi:glycosyltransferase involved in cell wall biosynthesis
LDQQFATLGPVFWFRTASQKEVDVSALNHLRQWRPDLIYSNTAMNGDVIEALDLPGCPVIVHVHELQWFLSTLDPLRLRVLLERTHVFLAVSAAVREQLQGMGVAGPRIFPAPAAIDAQAMGASSMEASPIHLEPHLTWIGAVGRADERKGADLFLEVAEALLASQQGYPPGGDFPRFALIWMGHGPLHARLKDAQRQWPGRFLAPGFVRNPYPVLAQCALFLMCSREDPCPLVNLEAGFLKVPVIGFSGSGGTDEVLAQGCGWLIPEFDSQAMAQKISEVLQPASRHLRSVVAEALHQKVLRHYEVRGVAEDVWTVISQCVPREVRDPSS